MGMQDYLDKYVKAKRQESFRDSIQITLGDLIKEIKECGTMNDDEDKTVDFDFGTALPTTLDSWRGSYAELALGYKLSGYDNDDDHFTEITAKDLLENLKSAIDKTFGGWKGGEYRMEESTPVWVANPGSSGNTGIIGVIDKGYKIVILTTYCEF